PAVRVLAVYEQRVTVHARGKPGGIERESQLGRRDAAAGTHREPLSAELEPRAPGKGALPRVGDRDAIGAAGRAAGGRRVADLRGRHVQRGDGRWRVGELVDLAGRE